MGGRTVWLARVWFRQVSISSPASTGSWAASPTRDPRFAAHREHQVIVVTTAFRGASFSFNITGATAGVFTVTVPTGAGANSTAIPFTANASQLCAGVAPMFPINGCRASQVGCTAASVRNLI